MSYLFIQNDSDIYLKTQKQSPGLYQNDIACIVEGGGSAPFEQKTTIILSFSKTSETWAAFGCFRLLLLPFLLLD